MRLEFDKLAKQAERALRKGLRRSSSVRMFGFELEAAGPGRAVMRMEVRSRHRQLHGVVHGGVVAALADTAAGLAVHLSAPRRTKVATVEMKINYLRAVQKGTLVAEARVLRVGKNLAVSECDVRDGSATLVAKALLTFSISPGTAPQR